MLCSSIGWGEELGWGWGIQRPFRWSGATAGWPPDWLRTLGDTDPGPVSITISGQDSRAGKTRSRPPRATCLFVRHFRFLYRGMSRAAVTAAKRKCNVGIINSPHPPCRQKNSQQLNVGWCCEQSKQTIDNDNGPSPTFLLPGCWVAGWSIPRCTVGAAPHTRYLWSGCLIDHLRPNQVNFYKRRRLVLLGFYPSQSIHGLDSR